MAKLIHLPRGASQSAKDFHMQALEHNFELIDANGNRLVYRHRENGNVCYSSTRLSNVNRGLQNALADMKTKAHNGVSWMEEEERKQKSHAPAERQESRRLKDYELVMRQGEEMGLPITKEIAKRLLRTEGGSVRGANNYLKKLARAQIRKDIRKR